MDETIIRINTDFLHYLQVKCNSMTFGGSFRVIGTIVNTAPHSYLIILRLKLEYLQNKV